MPAILSVALIARVLPWRVNCSRPDAAVNKRLFFFCSPPISVSPTGCSFRFVPWLSISSTQNCKHAITSHPASRPLPWSYPGTFLFFFYLSVAGAAEQVLHGSSCMNNCNGTQDCSIDGPSCSSISRINYYLLEISCLDKKLTPRGVSTKYVFPSVHALPAGVALETMTRTAHFCLNSCACGSIISTLSSSSTLVFWLFVGVPVAGRDAHMLQLAR